MTETASTRERELDQLVQMQICTLGRKAPLSSSELNEYSSRSERIRVLRRELEQVARERLKAEMANHAFRYLRNSN